MKGDGMKNRIWLYLPAAMLIFAGTATTQQTDPSKTKSRAAEEVTMTGCLNKGEMENHYAFTDMKTGKKMTVTGPANLEKHSANHTVKLTGSQTAKVFNATKVEHVAATCEVTK
jgi:hypothetical protein